MSDAAEQLPEESNIDLGEPEIEQPVEAVETPEPEPEPTPEPPPPDEGKVEFTPEQQRVLNEQIGKKVAKQRAAEREAEEARRKAEEYEAKLNELQRPLRPDVPPLPDPFADNYEEQVRLRDEAIQKQAEFDARAQAEQFQRDQQAQQQEQEQLQKQMEAAATYSDRAGKLGIKPEELQQAGMAVAQYGIQDELVHHILGDEQGPNLTVYLSQNPLELEQLRQMTPLRAAIYMETELKPKAVASRPTPDLAPPPVEPVKGSGAPEPERGVPGTVYE